MQKLSSGLTHSFDKFNDTSTFCLALTPVILHGVEDTVRISDHSLDRMLNM